MTNRWHIPYVGRPVFYKYAEGRGRGPNRKEINQLKRDEGALHSRKVMITENGNPYWILYMTKGY